MGVQYDIQIRDTHLSVVASGDFDHNGFRAMLREALLVAHEHNRHRILFDAREIAGNLSTVDYFNLGEMVARMLKEHLGFSFNLAYVGTEQFLDPNRLGETVARNRGAYGIVTSDMSEAYEWLGIKSEPE